MAKERKTRAAYKAGKRRGQKKVGGQKGARKSRR